MTAGVFFEGTRKGSPSPLGTIVTEEIRVPVGEGIVKGGRLGSDVRRLSRDFGELAG
jgi:hypothetical protein